MPTTPNRIFSLSDPITVRGMKSHLVGLNPWFEAAAQEGFGDEEIRDTILDCINEFQNQSRLRVCPSQIVMDDTGVYNGTFGVEAVPGLELPLIVERYDRLPFYPDSADQWFRTELPANPVRKIQQVQFYLGKKVIYDVPQDWIIFDYAEGTLHLLPFWGALNSVMSAVGASIVMGGNAPSYGTPQAMAITYVAGLPDDWNRQPRWSYIRQGLERWAAHAVLEKIAEVFDPGLTNSAASAFGLSQQANYTRFQQRKGELANSKAELLATVQPKTEFDMEAI